MATVARFCFLIIYLQAENAQGDFGIKEPFPENIYPIEGTENKVTCVAFDSTGAKSPERIQFVRRDRFARYANISANENVLFAERIESAVPPASNKLFVTMTIKNVTLNDDSTYGELGRYECHAFAVGDPMEYKHGFSVNVILRDEIPLVTVPRLSVLRHGENTTLRCNLTKNEQVHTQTGLKRISWYKDGVLLESIRNPDPNEPLDTLRPLVLDNIGVRDGGNYTCLVEVKLRNIRNYNVSDSTMVEIAPWFDKPTEVTEVTFVEGQDVSLQCAAQGFPLRVEWKLQKDSEDFVRPCINGSDGKYHVHRSGIYDPYVLTVSDLRYTDLGSYYCCLPSNCSDNIQDNCQQIVLPGGFGIQEPFPENIYPIEGNSAKVTCVAFDSLGLKTPERIQFVRRDKFARYKNITATDNNYYFEENVTLQVDQGGKRLPKLFVTMVIRNVTLNDDSSYGALGRYECHAFALGDPLERKHGFSVNVIAKDEIPSVSVPNVGVLQLGENITVFCKMTEGKEASSRTELIRISWYKDGVLQQTLRNPDPTNPQDTLGALILANDRSEDGGNYTCLLEVLLRSIKLHSVSDSTIIEITPGFHKPIPVVNVTVKKGDNASLECAAQGFPLHVEWKVQKDGEDFVQPCITNGSDGKYHVHRSGIHEPYVLNITDVQNTDLGSYYCCLPSNCSANVQENCQQFVLRGPDSIPVVKGCEGNSLLPWIIAVAVEGVLLVVSIAADVMLAIKVRKMRAKEDEKGEVLESIYHGTQDTSTTNPAKAVIRQIGKEEHQTLQSCSRECDHGYSVVGHRKIMAPGEGLYMSLSASESTNSVNGASNFGSLTYVNQLPSYTYT